MPWVEIIDKAGLADPKYIYKYAYWEKKKQALPDYVCIRVLNEEFEWVVAQQVPAKNVRPLSPKEVFVLSIKQSPQMSKIKKAIS